MKRLVDLQRAFFNTGATKEIDFRINQLKKLKNILKQNESSLNRAIFEDFGKSEFDTYTTELAMLYSEIDYTLKNIKKWSRWRGVTTDLVNLPAKSFIIPEPLGVTLIIGAWNYPYQLSFAPVIAAIGAGNTVILKPSELPAKTAGVMAELVNNNFDEQFFRVVEGGVEETQELLQNRFDKIFFTGSVRVGRVVYMAASKFLTPVTLELGGKSPAFILDRSSLKMYVKRLVWAKFLNAGQTCIAPDYVLIDKSLKDDFIKLAVEEIERESFSVENGNYVKIINEKNVLRLSNLLSSGTIAYGGLFNVQERRFGPTILDNVSFEDPVMQEEIFGPILPVIPFDTLEHAIEKVKEGEKPLSCYIFTKNDDLKKKILSQLSFGGGCVNDAIMHVSGKNLPFGGVGESGMGSYHGKYGFSSFSHYKSVLEKPTWFEPSIKYSPHTKGKLNFIKKII